MGTSMALLDGRIIPTLMIVNGQLLPHFTVEYRKYFTNFHSTVVETAGGIQIGATESCLIMYCLQFFFAMQSDTNASNADIIDAQKLLGLPFELKFTKGALIALSTFVLSIQYNVGNFIAGFSAAKNKMHALFCMIPFF